MRNIMVLFTVFSCITFLLCWVFTARLKNSFEAYPLTTELRNRRRVTSFTSISSNISMEVAIIVPYRNREIHLKIFTHYMNTFLMQQNNPAKIYVIEQAGNGSFNRAKLFNVGYKEARKDGHFNCFIFHDIDLLPENVELPYTCSVSNPLHLCVAIDKYKYRLSYKTSFGGVSALTESQMQRCNGFPNRYWGWGAEDDDMWRRVHVTNMRVKRPSPLVGRYTMLRQTGQHVAAARNMNRIKLLRRAKLDMFKDGLNYLRYTPLKKEERQMYVWILADLQEVTG